MKTLFSKANIWRLLPALFVGMASVASAQEPSLGRLFSTPAERILLEERRQQADHEVTEISAGDDSLAGAVVNANGNGVRPPPPQNLELRLGGSVLRSSGDNTIWINGLPVTQRDLPSGMRIVQHRHLLALHIAEGDKAIMLMPGQRFHVASRSISNMPLATESTAAAGPATAYAAELRNTLNLVMEYMR